jgi:hypothetical protein
LPSQRTPWQGRLRDLSRTVLEDCGHLHDPETVSGSYLVVASILRI